MNLQEYITAEFGIVPDTVQLEQIREIVLDQLGKIGVQMGWLSGPNPDWDMSNKDF